MADDNTQAPTKPPLQWTKSPQGVFEVYVNMSHIVWSADDIRVRVGQIIDSPKNPNPGPDFEAVVEERAAITLSWRNAANLRDQLIALIKSYEEVNGPIKMDVKIAPAPF